MKPLLLIISFLMCSAANAQTDTVYNDKRNMPCAKDTANSMEVTTRINDTSYFVAVYKNNPVRLGHTHYYKSIDPPVYHGEAVHYYKNGDTVRGWYNNNMYTGEMRDYYDRETEDTLQAVYNLKNQQLHGTLISYYPNGKVKRRARYAFDKLVQGHQYDERGNEIDFSSYMVMPEPIQDINKFLAKNIKYPPKALRKNIQGRVLVQFTVTKDGTIKQARVISDTPEILNAEALRIVNKMKPWKPGSLDDKPVNVFFTLPVMFKLN